MTILDSHGRPFEQKSGAAGSQLGARAGEYLAQNLQAYPITAVFIAGAIGYGLAYLVHAAARQNGGRDHRRADLHPSYLSDPGKMRRERVPHSGEVIGRDMPDESKERHTEIAVEAGRTQREKR